MKYVSIQKLAELRNLQDEDHETISTLDWLINAHCKELPQEQWQTIEEFKINPVDGWCFLIHSRFNNRTMGNYSLGRFWIDGGICKEENITHVMPIKTPEAPK